MLKFDFGKLREWRKDKGYSQAQVAEKIDRSAATISKWELGTTSIPTEDFVKLVSLYDANIDDAFYRPLVDDEIMERPEAERKVDK